MGVLKTSVAPFGMLLAMRSLPSPERFHVYALKRFAA
jgi:hypothetical protein